MLMLFVLKKEQTEHARLRALATAIVNKEKTKEAFEDYMKLAFPWIEGQKKKDASYYSKILLEHVKNGALNITPLTDETARMKSRLKAKVIERAAPDPAKKKEQLDRLYKQFGKTIYQ